MPDLDVSDILTDPDFADSFDVIRRTQTIDNHGRSVDTETTYANQIGVITNASPNDLNRIEDYQNSQRYLSIVTKFRLQLPSTGKNADIVSWRGDRYLVKTLEPYPQYGQGFYQAIVASTDILDQPI